MAVGIEHKQARADDEKQGELRRDDDRITHHQAGFAGTHFLGIPGDGHQPEPRRATSLGSGFIIDPSGYIVTNNHVIEGAEEITVRMQDNTEYKAKLIGHDPKQQLDSGKHSVG